MKIITEAIRGKDLKPGDVFSFDGPLYWNNLSQKAMGEKVYIRTNNPLPPNPIVPFFLDEQVVYKITIEGSTPKQNEALAFAAGVARVMNDFRSSSMFFVLQQAYGEMEWKEAQAILDKVIEQTKSVPIANQG